VKRKIWEEAAPLILEAHVSIGGLPLRLQQDALMWNRFTVQTRIVSLTL